MKKSLDTYDDDMPREMRRYLSHYGFHFSKAACDYAVDMFLTRSETAQGGLMKTKTQKLKPITKEQLDNMLELYNIKIENNTLYDYLYVANMCKADFYGSSITDDLHLCKFVKDTIDDVDASDETTFRRWMATMIGNGEPIDWDEMM